MALKVAGLTSTSSPRRMHKRDAKWLQDQYEATTWVITDTIGEGYAETVDFHVPLPNGRYLTEEPELYRTVKEFIFWIREGPYTRIDDAARHKQYALSIIQIAWGLVARGYSSFASLSKEVVHEICEGSTKGRDGITSASVLLRTLLDGYASWSEVPSQFAAGRSLDFPRLVSALHIPDGWDRPPLRREIAYTTARLNGKTIVRSGPKQITVQNVHLITIIFEALYQLRHFMQSDSIAFNPFDDGAYAMAVSLGANTVPTPIAPPELVLKFIRESANYIVRNARKVTAHFLEVRASAGTESWSELTAREAKSQVRWVADAAFVLIAAFSARRLEEIYKLRRDCLKGSDQHGWWMEVYIEKLREWTWIPVPRIVARAVEAMKSMDADNPDVSQSLFILNDPLTGKRIKLKHRMKSFAEKLGADAYVGRGGISLSWNWTPRQFRRFFAVLYIYRWFGKKETLAHHLRHHDLQTANDYLRLDPEVSDIWLKEIANYKTFVAERVAANDGSFAGPMGDRLQKYIERVRRVLDQNVMIIPEEKAEVILRLMKKLHLVVTVKAWVTCCCPATQGGCERAACRKDAGFASGSVGPDFVAAGPSICPGCPWALVSEGNVDFMELELEELTDTAAQASGVFAELASEKVVVLSRYRESLRKSFN
ncbi:hypothetical protein [Neorhizobium sp. IRS_2294]|uniref:hypothetical protein n=1 Tax=unclassified Neorhizobium TaxID=2629175 RepID=UPI003D2DB1B9